MNHEQFPLISVIIPYYNHNKYVTKTLDSILKDTYPNKEIIIINDGSTEENSNNLTSWIEKNRDNILITYTTRENQGLTRTLNELISLSKGEYICVCASDDYFINNTFIDRVKILQDNPNKKISIADNIVIDDKDEIISKSNLFDMRHHKKNAYMTDFRLKKMIIKQWGLVGPCWFARKDLFTEIGMFDQSLIVEDWDFMLRVVSKDLAIFYSDKAVAAYRLHQNNTISNPEKQIRMWEDLYYTAKKHIKSFKNPYFKYLMWKNSRKNLKKLNKLKKIQAGHSSD